MKIEYYRKDVYGSPLNYVKNELLGKKLARLIGTKTVNQSQMNELTELFDIEWVQVLP